jgi:predicted nucleic acid-binding protein
VRRLRSLAAKEGVSVEEATIADRWGRLALDQPLPVSDGLLAATGIEHKLAIVTRNRDDFVRSGVSTLNPFSARKKSASR